MADGAIINASPLIFFSRSRRLQLLQALADEVWVPEPVAAEILRRGITDVSARAIQDTAWLTVLVAKRRGLIPEARPVIEEMVNAGLHLSRRVLDEALRRVNE